MPPRKCKGEAEAAALRVSAAGGSEEKRNVEGAACEDALPIAAAHALSMEHEQCQCPLSMDPIDAHFSVFSLSD